jgi:2-C-methyl-D-erythritol 4-phosphate cytidylyltransferase
VVVNNSNRAAVARLVREKKIGKVESLVEGGRRRQDSVRRALKGLDSAAGLVLIHDAARPFISRDEISRVIRQAAKSGAAILAVPVKATIKKIRPSPGKRRGKSRYYVEGTLRRDTLVEVQTPQVFDKEIILKAYRRFGAATVTDDASLVEKSGREVSIVRGCYHNIKITTPEDLLIAEAIAGRINSKSQIPNPK